MVPAIKSSGFFSQHCTGENWILIGDAAGQVNPIKADGIYYAIKSGKLAAEACIKNDLPSYDFMWRKTYGKLLSKHTHYNEGCWGTWRANGKSNYQDN
ncbi:hypothetical protein KJ966_02175 [bacterium]|nr:hypothetical protein [bacterium]